MLDHDIVLHTLRTEKKGGRRWKLVVDGERINVESTKPGEILLISQGEETVRENPGVCEAEAIKCKAAEALVLAPSTVGYKTMLTQLHSSEALFEPCVSNPKARALCSGIVTVNPSPDPRKSYITVPYLSVERERIEIDESATLGFVRSTIHEEFASMSQVAGIHKKKTQERMSWKQERPVYLK